MLVKYVKELNHLYESVQLRPVVNQEQCKKALKYPLFLYLQLM